MKPKTLNEVIEVLTNIKKGWPELADKPVCYASDDEGNSFQEAYYLPSIGKLEGRGFETTENNPTHTCLN